MIRKFISSNGIGRMKKDFDALLNAPEHLTITLNYLSSHTGTWDVDEGIYIDGVETWSSKELSAIMKTITMYDTVLINTGAVTVGDSVFFISRSEDIAALLDAHEKRWYFTYREINWYPINTDPLIAENALVPLGTSQISQAIPCKRKESAVAEEVSDSGVDGTEDGGTW